MWLKPSSTQNYSSNKRLQFSYILNNSRYSNKLNIKSMLPGNTRYCKKYRLRHYYNSHTMLILLNKPCRLSLNPNSTQNYSSSRRLLFSYMLSTTQYSSKLNMKSLSPSKSHYCKQCTHLSSDYMCYNL